MTNKQTIKEQQEEIQRLQTLYSKAITEVVRLNKEKKQMSKNEEAFYITLSIFIFWIIPFILIVASFFVICYLSFNPRYKINCVLCSFSIIFT